MAIKLATDYYLWQGKRYHVGCLEEMARQEQTSRVKLIDRAR